MLNYEKLITSVKSRFKEETKVDPDSIIQPDRFLIRAMAEDATGNLLGIGMLIYSNKENIFFHFSTDSEIVFTEFEWVKTQGKFPEVMIAGYEKVYNNINSEWSVIYNPEHPTANSYSSDELIEKGYQEASSLRL